MSDYSLWDEPLYEAWTGATMRYYGLALDEAYRLWQWQQWARSLDA